MKKQKNEHLWHHRPFSVYQRRIVDGNRVELKSPGGGIDTSIVSVNVVRRLISTGAYVLVPGQGTITPAERVRRVLKTLAERKDIAGYLRKKGIKAEPWNACQCVLAVFVKTVTNIDIGIGTDGEWWLSDGCSVSRGTRQYKLQPVLTSFASAFDRKKYPELIA